MEKVDYKKEYKDLYMPKNKPSIIKVPKMKFIMVSGSGDPNTSKEYAEALEILYGLSFTIKMSKMGSNKIKGYFEYVVPPLEGLWSSENVIKDYQFINKDEFIWISMIRQPEFVTNEVFEWAKEQLLKKKPELDLSKAKFEEFEEGLCVQVMHIGSYDSERVSFEIMNEFLQKEGLTKDFRHNWHHHEIYLTDPRRCAPDKNKTVLRIPVR